jgi:acyl dehydratase
MKGLYLEDIPIGMQDVLGSHHFTREAVLRFARAFDPQPFHLDDGAAARSHFKALCASGWHTASGWMSCYVTFNERHRQKRARLGERLPDIGPSPGFENMKWLKPVYPGDTVTDVSLVTGKRSLKSREGWGLLLTANTGTNQKGEAVFSFDGKVLVQLRG